LLEAQEFPAFSSVLLASFRSPARGSFVISSPRAWRLELLPHRVEVLRVFSRYHVEDRSLCNFLKRNKAKIDFNDRFYGAANVRAAVSLCRYLRLVDHQKHTLKADVTKQTLRESEHATTLSLSLSLSLFTPNCLNLPIPSVYLLLKRVLR
jgi:hypothetical protein